MIIPGFLYYFCNINPVKMSTHSIIPASMERSEHERWPVSKWSKFISLTLFSEASILFLLSFLLFFVKRTYDTDPRLISGAFSGTIQLTYFIVINIFALILALQGYYLFYFKDEAADSSDNLRKFFKVAGVSIIPLFITVVTVFLSLFL